MCCCCCYGDCCCCFGLWLLKCCFTSTETVGLLGRGPRTSTSSFTHLLNSQCSWHEAERLLLLVLAWSRKIVVVSLGMKPEYCCCYSWHEAERLLLLFLAWSQNIVVVILGTKPEIDFVGNAVVDKSLGSFFFCWSCQTFFLLHFGSFLLCDWLQLGRWLFDILTFFPIYFSCHYSVKCSFRSLLVMLFRVTDLSLDVDILISDIPPHLFQLSIERVRTRVVVVVVVVVAQPDCLPTVVHMVRA